MAYTAWNVVFGEQPSAAKWNLLGSNDAFFNDWIESDRFKVGSFTLGAVGVQAVTGVGFQAKLLTFGLLDADSATIARGVMGAVDADLNQWTNGWRAASGDFATDSDSAQAFSLRNAGATLASFSVTSIDTDGFTLDVNVSASQGVGYIAYA